MSKGYVSKDQLKRAREHMTALDYILCYEAADYKRVGRGYRFRSDDALAVDENGWYCHKRCMGSRTALDYLVEIKGYSLVDAVCSLLGEEPEGNFDSAKTTQSSNRPKPTATSSKKSASTTRPPPALESTLQATSDTNNDSPKREAISLPLRNKDNKRVIAYLQSRDIDRDLIIACTLRGVLFESKFYHNAVFLGKDENNKTKFAAMRSTTTNFMRDAEGSDKKYGFVILPDNPYTNKVAAFESPIDCLSHQTLCKQGYIPPFDGWRLSLGGSSIVALEYFLEQQSYVNHCVVCVDSDKAGEKLAVSIADIQGITSERSPPIYGKDWNESLQIVKRSERTQSRNHRAERS